MERLGLEPGDSATARLGELVRDLDEHTMRSLQAATGWNGELFWLAIGVLGNADVPELFPRIRRGSQDKTRTTVDLSAGLAQHGQRALLYDLDPQMRALPWAPRDAAGAPDVPVAGPVVVDLPPLVTMLDEGARAAERAVPAASARMIAELIRQPAGPRLRHRREPGTSDPGLPGNGDTRTPPTPDSP
ncbi:hypothetical protein ACFRMQ_00035 [Kitasatospora sp. NPDC056783]|uniref:hypothetical protein n=1 Tax=Kitasatospora sp. NPDC056783 TaxID=3345943 RepID=UPI00368E5914